MSIAKPKPMLMSNTNHSTTLFTGKKKKFSSPGIITKPKPMLMTNTNQSTTLFTGKKKKFSMSKNNN